MSEAAILETGGDVRAATRDLILALADSKRLLGTRYAEWILGAPELETGIACASMAQDEFGHGRLLYALLKEFGDDVDRLEHGREPAEYRNIEALDRAPESWPELVAVNAFVDAALTVQLRALTESSHAPLRQRVGKLLDEEAFHAVHAAAWCRRLAGASDEARALLATASRRTLPGTLRWFGPAGSTPDVLAQAGVSNADAEQLRTRYIETVRPLLESIGELALINQPIDFTGYDAQTRRSAGTMPDAETIQRIRGDKNRAFLMD